MGAPVQLTIKWGDPQDARVDLKKIAMDSNGRESVRSAVLHVASIAARKHLNLAAL